MGQLRIKCPDLDTKSHQSQSRSGNKQWERSLFCRLLILSRFRKRNTGRFGFGGRWDCIVSIFDGGERLAGGSRRCRSQLKFDCGLRQRFCRRGASDRFGFGGNRRAWGDGRSDWSCRGSNLRNFWDEKSRRSRTVYRSKWRSRARRSQHTGRGRGNQSPWRLRRNRGRACLRQGRRAHGNGFWRKLQRGKIGWCTRNRSRCRRGGWIF